MISSASRIEFFTSFEWWKTEHDELVNNGAYCLAEPGEVYAVYLPKEGTVTVKLEPGSYKASWFSAFIPTPVSRSGWVRVGTGQWAVNGWHGKL